MAPPECECCPPPTDPLRAAKDLAVSLPGCAGYQDVNILRKHAIEPFAVFCHAVCGDRVSSGQGRERGRRDGARSSVDRNSGEIVYVEGTGTSFPVVMYRRLFMQSEITDVCWG